MREWRCFGHVARMEDESPEKQTLYWDPRRAKRRGKRGKGQFWMKQENVAKYGARLRGWRAAGSAGDGSQMRYVLNEQKTHY